MISITERIKISPLTIFMFAFSSFFHYPVIFFITYAMICLHELAHMAAAHFIGLRTECIVLQPFGLNLRLQSKITPSVLDEIILYLAGPFANALLALCAALAYIKYADVRLKDFYDVNLVLFSVNLLPAMPLDGGCIVRSILTRLIGYRRAFILTLTLSASVCAALAALGVYAFTRGGNFSVLLFAALLGGNLLTQRIKYNSGMTYEEAQRFIRKRV